ncbi:hypothetical protein UF78_17910 [Stutzerimonas stutzeri]|uniref:Uncharacterized protein n=1 Tax=Stutzerimonas stutzeri TaxID=316 RepID=A0A0D9AHE1_STUST|nr:hypothetical protein UF78_17910 [Stutzerimonas stutzeri]
MTKPLLIACGLALCAPMAFAQTPKPEVITHLNGLDVEVSAMGVPTSTSAEAGVELVGIRAVRVMNKSEETVTCEFHVPDEARADTSAPPVFTVTSNSQRVERVPGDYSPDKPFAELTCRAANQSVGTPTAVPSSEPSSEPAEAEAPAASGAEDGAMRSREASGRDR